MLTPDNQQFVNRRHKKHNSIGSAGLVKYNNAANFGAAISNINMSNNNQAHSNHLLELKKQLNSDVNMFHQLSAPKIYNNL